MKNSKNSKVSSLIYLEKLVSIINRNGFSVRRFYRFPSNRSAVISYCSCCCCFNRQLGCCDHRFRRFRRPFVLELELLAEFGVEVTKNGWRCTAIGSLLSVVIVMNWNTVGDKKKSQKKVRKMKMDDFSQLTTFLMVPLTFSEAT